MGLDQGYNQQGRAGETQYETPPSRTVMSSRHRAPKCDGCQSCNRASQPHKDESPGSSAELRSIPVKGKGVES